MVAFDATRCQTTLFAALLAASKAHGRSTLILKDADGTNFTYAQLIIASLVLGRKLAALARPGEPIALMLPNVAALPVALFGLNAYGRTAAILNYTVGPRNLAAALQLGRITTLVTSRRFIEKANLQPVLDQLATTEPIPGRHLTITYLEDIRATITWRDKLLGALSAPISASLHARTPASAGSTAVLLFTSGTEGTPKGVALTNANVTANTCQIFAHADGHLSSADRVLNPLPMFHSFGLTAGTLMPILNGMRVTLYPSPLHYREIARLAHADRTTVLFATDTFMAGYAKAAKPGDLDSIRVVVAGAERVKDSTRTLWASTKAEIIEGYGATECAPVIAVNIPGSNRHGTVGRVLPGIDTRLIPIEGLSEGGRLEVRGPNVMAGYIEPTAPGIITPPREGWHDTGDIVTIDDGFITIRGRAKRFAKLGGEMISLAAVESLASSLWPEANHVVVAIPDPKKGEQLILVTDKPDADRATLLAHAQASGFPELWVPRAILVTASIPMLGSGKTDFPATLAMVRQNRPML